MNSRFAQSCAVALAVSLAAAAVAGPRPAAAEADAVLDVQMQMHASYFSERCMEFPPNEQLSFSVEAEYPVDFNVHRHTETATEYPVKLRVEQSYTGTLTVAGGEYCFMWQNPANRPGDFQVTLRYKVSPR